MLLYHHRRSPFGCWFVHLNCYCIYWHHLYWPSHHQYLHPVNDDQNTLLFTHACLSIVFFSPKLVKKNSTYCYRIRCGWALANEAVRWRNKAFNCLFFCSWIISLHFLLIHSFTVSMVFFNTCINADDWTHWGSIIILIACCPNQTTEKIWNFQKFKNHSINLSIWSFESLFKIYLKLAVCGWVFVLYAVGSCGNASGWTFSSESESSVKSRTWNLLRPLNTISRLRGRCFRRSDEGGDFL